MKRRIYTICIVLCFVLFSLLISRNQVLALTPTLMPSMTSTAFPGAEFSGTPLTGTAPLTVQFTHLNANFILSCTWTFGDGTTQTVSPTSSQTPSVCPSVSHVYTLAGSYTVKLTVTKATNGFSSSITKTNYVVVLATDPTVVTNTATFTPRPGCGTVVVVTSTPSPTFTPTPRVATATATSCGPIFVTATPSIAGDLGFGTVSGKVTDASSGAAIAGAVVTCTQSSSHPVAPCSGTRTTAADGTYSFTGVFFHDTDHMTVSVDASGYVSQTFTKTSFTSAGMTTNFALAATSALPDLTVVSITEFTYTAPTPTPNVQGCWPSGPTAKIGLRVTIQNIGTGNAGAFAVDLNGSIMNISGLAAGQSLAVDYMGMALTRTRTATVDATGLITESNESNNTLTVTLSVATSTSTGTPPPQICATITPSGSLPDLTISSITFAGSTPTCANSLKANVVVTNLGAAAAGTFFVSVNGTQMQVTSLGAGQSITLVVPAVGSITATADSTNLVAETNENNNTLVVNIPLPSQAPTCTPTGPTLTPTRTLTLTRTPTGQVCITATPERMMVAPVTSPTSAVTQVVTVTLNNGSSVTITNEAGSFTSNTKVGNVFSVTVNLVSNSANHLQVQGTVNAANLCAPYTLSTTVDSSGNPLTIVQSSGPTLTPTLTPTPAGGICGPVNATIAAPFTQDGVGNFCWQSSNLGAFINSWNLTTLTVNGVNETNLYVASGSYPAKINGFWYIRYNSPVAWGHFEVR